MSPAPLEGQLDRGKLNTEWTFLKHLHDTGHRTASSWLYEYFDDLGKRSTLDIESVYLSWKEDYLG